MCCYSVYEQERKQLQRELEHAKMQRIYNQQQINTQNKDLVKW